MENKNIEFIRLHRMKNGIKKYVHQEYVFDKKCYKNMRFQLTENVDEAYAFRSVEELIQFDNLIRKNFHGLNADTLVTERFDSGMTYDEVFGTDPNAALKESYAGYLQKKDTHEQALSKAEHELRELKAINVEELPSEKQVEVLETIKDLEKLRDFHLVKLHELSEVDEEEAENESSN